MVPVADCRLPQLATSLERQLRVEQTRQVELSGQLAAAAELQQRQLDELRHTRDTLEAEKTAGRERPGAAQGDLQDAADREGTGGYRAWN